MPAVWYTQICTDAIAAVQSEFVPIGRGQVRHGVAADQGRRGHMEDATVTVPDFRDNLGQELAAQAPDANSFYGVGISTSINVHTSSAQSLTMSNKALRQTVRQAASFSCAFVCTDG